MEITEVRIKLMSSKNDKLRAFCSITLDDCFVIRDLKIIEGTRGPFVAMPSRKLTERCKRCGEKNPHRAKFCSECGVRVSSRPLGPDVVSRLKMHADIAHPINQRCRELIQSRVIEEYMLELDRAKDPGYRPRDLEGFEEDDLIEVSETAGVEDQLAAAQAIESLELDAAESRPGRQAEPARDRPRSLPGRRVDRAAQHGMTRASPREVGPPTGEPRGPGRVSPLSHSPGEPTLREVAHLEPSGPEVQSHRDPIPGPPAGESEDNFGAGLFS